QLQLHGRGSGGSQSIAAKGDDTVHMSRFGDLMSSCQGDEADELTVGLKMNERLGVAGGVVNGGAQRENIADGLLFPGPNKVELIDSRGRRLLGIGIPNIQCCEILIATDRRSQSA